MERLTSSVILCTRNRLDDLLLCLASLQEQTQKPQELIIVDSSTLPLQEQSRFTTYFIAQLFPEIKLIYHHTKPGLTYQRNVGIGLATQDVIYFFDDDVILERSYLEKMNTVFEAYPHYAGGMGTITNMQSYERSLHRFMRRIFFLQRDYAQGRFTLSGMPTHAYGSTTFQEVEVLGGCCMAYRAQVFKSHRFDEKLTGYAYMEDCDFSRRVSYDQQLFFNPDARLEHHSSPLNRDAVRANRAMFIKNYSYLFFKNIYPYSKLKIVAYCWSIIGLFFDAIVMRNKEYAWGYYQGLKEYYR